MTQSPLLENDMKVRLADFLVQQNMHDIVFATEVPFADAARRADFVCINGKLTAYEIKSDKDNVENLTYQINDYRQCFDEVYTVTTGVHLPVVKKILPRAVGLILVDNHNVSIVRSARYNFRLNKFYLASFLPKKELVSLLGDSKVNRERSSTMGIFELREYVAKRCKAEDLRRMAIVRLKERYNQGHNNFLSYRGSFTHSEDLLHLNLAHNIVQRR